MTNFTATACHGKLYVIGSCAVKYNALTMQCYNPVIGKYNKRILNCMRDERDAGQLGGISTPPVRGSISESISAKQHEGVRESEVTE